ncbi:fasciclin domain-containing protein [Rhodopseudomonas pseudopalustris]|uniref:fasciclin domain-containing protein n=1 Tax=Rhodopseudomonas pseudopalustris TaxID=1513892 RepID=UPI003F98D132
MSKRIALSAAVIALAASVQIPAHAEDKMMRNNAGMTKSDTTVMVGGAAMVPSKNIVENAAASKDHTTLVAAVKAAGLVGTLEGKGPFTVFAPTNAAFGKLPGGTVDNLLKPENKATLTKILTYHVVPGKLEAADLKDGQKLKTVEGDELTVRTSGGKVTITDAKGGSATVAIPNVGQSNGVIHVIDTVLMPAS